jgi:hypothetical protein
LTKQIQSTKSEERRAKNAGIEPTNVGPPSLEYTCTENESGNTPGIVMVGAGGVQVFLATATTPPFLPSPPRRMVGGEGDSSKVATSISTRPPTVIISSAK